MTEEATGQAHRRTGQMLADPELGGDLLLVGLALAGLLDLDAPRVEASASGSAMWRSWRGRAHPARGTSCGGCWPVTRAPTERRSRASVRTAAPRQ